MGKRDMSPAAVARRFCDGKEEIFTQDIAAILRADRARTRRIVRRERAQYTGPDHMVSGQVACDRILAALEEPTR